MAIDQKFVDDPVHEDRDLSHLKRTDKPRGFHARRLLENGQLMINPELARKFESVKQIEEALEEYLERHSDAA